MHVHAPDLIELCYKIIYTIMYSHTPIQSAHQTLTVIVIPSGLNELHTPSCLHTLGSMQAVQWVTFGVYNYN